MGHAIMQIKTSITILFGECLRRLYAIPWSDEASRERAVWESPLVKGQG